MKPVIFRCPVSNMNVQWYYKPPVASEEQPAAELLEAVDCPACGGMHLFNRKTGKLRATRSPGRPESR